MIDAPVNTPIKRQADVPPAFYDDAVPPAFYDDDEPPPPPPPPDDPHWREWWNNDGYEPVPRWIIYGLPALILFAAVFHAVLILIVLKASG